MNTNLYGLVRVLFGVRSEAERTYQNVIQEYSKEGWRLIQIFSPSLGFWGLSRYFELIFER